MSNASLGVLLAVPLAHVLTVVLVDVLRTSYIELQMSAMWDSRVALFLAAIVVLITFTTGLIHLLSARREWSLADAFRASAPTTTGRYGQMRRVLGGSANESHSTKSRVPSEPASQSVETCNTSARTLSSGWLITRAADLPGLALQCIRILAMRSRVICGARSGNKS